jgi:hypothetical protein
MDPVLPCRLPDKFNARVWEEFAMVVSTASLQVNQRVAITPHRDNDAVSRDILGNNRLSLRSQACCLAISTHEENYLSKG